MRSVVLLLCLIIFKVAVMAVYIMRPTVLLALVVVFLAPFAYAEVVTLDLDSQRTEIVYEASGVEVESVRHTDDTLIFSINAYDDGLFIVTLDRDLIDAKAQDGQDLDYIVLVDEFPTLFSESTTTELSRTLRIPVEIGSIEVEIVGTAIAKSSELNVESDADNVTDVESDSGQVMEPDDQVMEPKDEMPDEMEDSVPEMKDTVHEMEDSTSNMGVACGRGTTIGPDGITCVLIDKPVVSFRDLAFGAGAGLVVSFIVMLVLYPLRRASRS